MYPHCESPPMHSSTIGYNSIHFMKFEKYVAGYLGFQLGSIINTRTIEWGNAYNKNIKEWY